MGKTAVYRRVLLKLSGETVMGSQPFGIHQEACIQVAHSLSFFHEAGIELGVVIGGGNIFRGLDVKSMRHGAHSSRPHGDACDAYLMELPFSKP